MAQRNWQRGKEISNFMRKPGNFDTEKILSIFSLILSINFDTEKRLERWFKGESVSHRWGLGFRFLASMGKARYYCTCSCNLMSTENRDRGNLGAAGCQPRSGFSERQWLKKIGQRLIEQVTWHPPLDSAYAQGCELAHTYSRLALNLLCSHV